MSRYHFSVKGNVLVRSPCKPAPGLDDPQSRILDPGITWGKGWKSCLLQWLGKKSMLFPMYLSLLALSLDSAHSEVDTTSLALHPSCYSRIGLGCHLFRLVGQSKLNRSHNSVHWKTVNWFPLICTTKEAKAICKSKSPLCSFLFAFNVTKQQKPSVSLLALQWACIPSSFHFYFLMLSWLICGIK